MPNTLSAKKRVRQTERRRSLNRWRKRRIKNQIRSFNEAVQARDVGKAEEELRKCASILDKIASTGTIHKNKAARQKSRLTRTLKELQGASAS